MKFSSQFDQHDTWCPISELENNQQSTTLCWNIFKPDLFTQIFTANSRYPKCVTREIKIHTHYNKDMLSVTDSCSGFWGKIKFWACWTVSYVQHHTSKFFLFSEKTDKHILTLAVLFMPCRRQGIKITLLPSHPEVCLVDLRIQVQQSPGHGLCLWIWLSRDLSSSCIFWAAVWKKTFRY